MALDYEIRKLSNDDRLIERELDEGFTEYAQKQFDKHERLNHKREANFYYWVLHLVDRLEEAGYEWEEMKEKVEELETYIEDWSVRPNLGKHFDERY